MRRVELFLKLVEKLLEDLPSSKGRSYASRAYEYELESARRALADFLRSGHERHGKDAWLSFERASKKLPAGSSEKPPLERHRSVLISLRQMGEAAAALTATERADALSVLSGEQVGSQSSKSVTDRDDLSVTRMSTDAVQTSNDPVTSIIGNRPNKRKVGRLPAQSIDATSFDPNSSLGAITQVPLGIKGQTLFHRLAAQLFSYVFDRELKNFVIEEKINAGRKRVDIVASNRSREGFFYELKHTHNIHCPYIFIECKNYAKRIKNPELDQLAGRLTTSKGRLGILLYRATSGLQLLQKACEDFLEDQKFIVALDESDLIQLVRMRQSNDDEGVLNFMDNRFRSLILRKGVQSDGL